MQKEAHKIKKITEEEEAKKYTAPALEKGLDIIELLAGEKTGLNLSEMARALNRSIGEIFRMIAVLERRGYVAQDSASGQYMLTTYLFELAHKLPIVRRLSAIAGPRMRQLASDIQQSAHLGIMADDEIIIIAQVDSPSNNVMTVRLGSKINIWKASSGRVIMSCLNENELQKLFDSFPIPKDVSKQKLMQNLKQIKKDGYVIQKSFVVRGVTNIAAPVFEHSGQVVASLTVPHIEHIDGPITFETCRKKLIDAANELSKALGANNVIQK